MEEDNEQKRTIYGVIVQTTTDLLGSLEDATLLAMITRDVVPSEHGLSPSCVAALICVVISSSLLTLCVNDAVRGTLQTGDGLFVVRMVVAALMGSIGFSISPSPILFAVSVTGIFFNSSLRMDLVFDELQSSPSRNVWGLRVIKVMDTVRHIVARASCAFQLVVLATNATTFRSNADDKLRLSLFLISLELLRGGGGDVFVGLHICLCIAMVDLSNVATLSCWLSPFLLLVIGDDRTRRRVLLFFLSCVFLVREMASIPLGTSLFSWCCSYATMDATAPISWLGLILSTTGT